MTDTIQRLVVGLADLLSADPSDPGGRVDLFEVRAVLALICVGLTCGMVGALVVGNKLAFFSDAMAHTAFAGVAVAYLGIILVNDIRSGREADPYLWAVPLVMAGIGAVAAAAIVFVKEQTQLTNDTVIGVFFAFALGLGGMLTETVRKRVNFDLESFLYGQVNFLTDADVARLFGMLLATAAIVHWKYNQFVFGMFNPALARSRGIPIRWNSYLFVVLLAVVVNLSIKAVGVLLINALLVVPAAAAVNVSSNVRRMYWVTLAGGLGAALVGYHLHNRVRIPVGGESMRFGPSGMVVVVAVGWFVVSLGLRAARRRFFGAAAPCSQDHGDGQYTHSH